MILALDVSLTATGWVVVDTEVEGPEKLVGAGCVRSAPDPKKRRQGRFAEATLERVAHVVRELYIILSQSSPIDLLVAEQPAGSQSFVAALSQGIMYGIIGSIREREKIPCQWVQPAAVKQSAGGSKQASKAKVQAGVLKSWPEISEMKLTKVAHEAICDALGALMAARNTDLYRMVQTEKGPPTRVVL